MAAVERELAVGCHVRMISLVHPRKKGSTIFGRITYIHTTLISAVVPHDMGHGYVVICQKSEVEICAMEDVPTGQMHFLR